MATIDITTDASTARARDGVRATLQLEALALVVVAVVLYARSGGTLVNFVTFFLAPDVSMIFYVFGARWGAFGYNVAHSTLGALGLAVAGFLGDQSALADLGLIWLAHIGVDRTLGYGLKYASGFGDTHLGRIGKSAKRA